MCFLHGWDSQFSMKIGERRDTTKQKAKLANIKIMHASDELLEITAIAFKLGDVTNSDADDNGSLPDVAVEDEKNEEILNSVTTSQTRSDEVISVDATSSATTSNQVIKIVDDDADYDYFVKPTQFIAVIEGYEGMSDDEHKSFYTALNKVASIFASVKHNQVIYGKTSMLQTSKHAAAYLCDLRRVVKTVRLQEENKNSPRGNFITIAHLECDKKRVSFDFAIVYFGKCNTKSSVSDRLMNGRCCPWKFLSAMFAYNYFHPSLEGSQLTKSCQEAMYASYRDDERAHLMASKNKKNGF